MAAPAMGREVGSLFRGGEHGVPGSPVARGSVARRFGGGDGVGKEREQRSCASSDGRLLPPRRFFPVAAAAIRKEGGEELAGTRSTAPCPRPPRRRDRRRAAARKGGGGQFNGDLQRQVASSKQG